MGVGYAEDLVVCVALGVDMFDCVYPTRTAVSVYIINECKNGLNKKMFIYIHFYFLFLAFWKCINNEWYFIVKNK